MTDKQLDKLFLRLERRIQEIGQELNEMADELGRATYELTELRKQRDEYRDRWLRA